MGMTLVEKILAAHRGKIKKILIPKENEKDLKDIPKKIVKDLEIKSVEHMDEVLQEALLVDASHKLFKKGLRRSGNVPLKKEKAQPGAAALRH